MNLRDDGTIAAMSLYSCNSLLLVIYDQRKHVGFVAGPGCIVCHNLWGDGCDGTWTRGAQKIIVKNIDFSVAHGVRHQVYLNIPIPAEKKNECT